MSEIESIKVSTLKVQDKLEAMQYALALLADVKEFTLTAKSSEDELEMVVFSNPNEESKVLQESIMIQFKVYETLKEEKS